MAAGSGAVGVVSAMPDSQPMDAVHAAIHPIRMMIRAGLGSSVARVISIASTTVDLARIQFGMTSLYHSCSCRSTSCYKVTNGAAELTSVGSLLGSKFAWNARSTSFS